MADKSFGVKELNLLNASGTPTVTSPNNLNLNANTVAISTSCTIGNNLTVTGGTSLSNLLVSGITTFSAGNTVDVRGNFTVSGISTIPQPADSNPMANWTITNNSASAYRFTGPGQSGSDDNPDLYLVRGHRYIFKHNATGSHPIQIRVSNGGAAYTDGVTYSNTGNNTTTDGNNLIINLQHDAPAQLYYQCTSHGGMVGNIYTVGGPQVISGVVTATTFVGNLTGTASANAVLTGSTNNQLVTVTGANAITGESGLTFDGSTLSLSPASSNAGRVTIFGSEGQDARLSLVADEGDDHIDQYNLRVAASNNRFYIDQFESGAFQERFTIANGGNVGIGGDQWAKLVVTSTSTNTSLTGHNYLASQSGMSIDNTSNTDGSFGAYTARVKNSGGTQQSGSLAFKSTSSGYTPEVHLTQRTGAGSQASRMVITSDGTKEFSNHGGGTIKVGGSSAHTSKIVIGDNAGTSNGNCLVEGGDGTDFFTIQSNGNVAFTNGRGINFAATSDAGNSATMSNELFDDYEEGSWSPTGSWTTITARYTKIGRMVFAGFSLRANASSGNVTIGGFPFTSASNHAASGGIAWGLCEFNSTSGWLNGSIGDGETSATIRKNNAVVLTFGSGSNNMNSGAFLRGTFIYHTA